MTNHEAISEALEQRGWGQVGEMPDGRPIYGKQGESVRFFLCNVSELRQGVTFETSARVGDHQHQTPMYTELLNEGRKAGYKPKPIAEAPLVVGLVRQLSD